MSWLFINVNSLLFLVYSPRVMDANEDEDDLVFVVVVAVV